MPFKTVLTIDVVPEPPSYHPPAENSNPYGLLLSVSAEKAETSGGNQYSTAEVAFDAGLETISDQSLQWYLFTLEKTNSGWIIVGNPVKIQDVIGTSVGESIDKVKD